MAAASVEVGEVAVAMAGAVKVAAASVEVEEAAVVTAAAERVVVVMGVVG